MVQDAVPSARGSSQPTGRYEREAVSRTTNNRKRADAAGICSFLYANGIMNLWFQVIDS